MVIQILFSILLKTIFGYYEMEHLIVINYNIKIYIFKNHLWMGYKETIPIYCSIL